MGLWVIDAGDPGAAASCPLPPEDEAAAARYERPEDRRACRLRRGLARTVLAGRLGVAPDQLEVDRSCEHCDDAKHGRPRLRAGGPQFSLSRAGTTIALAVADRPVGVDVELRATLRDLDGLADLAMSTSERATLDAADDRPGLLLAAWCVKEAVLKAAGVGLAGRLDEIDAISALDGRPCMLSLNGRRQFAVTQVDLGPGVVCVVAVEGDTTPTVVRRDQP